MVEVNPWYVWDALGGLEHGEAETGPLCINSDDEDCTKNAFRQHIEPRVAGWSAKRISVLRNSLAFYATKPSIFTDKILANLPHVSMTAPRDVRLFATWLWEVLFPAEEMPNIDEGTIMEDNDVMKTNRGTDELRIPPGSEQR